MRLICLLLVVLNTPCLGQNARRLDYLDENNPYYPGLKFPKLITPQWVGEEGVDAVEQDDAWKIDRVLLTLKGSRKAD